MITDWSRIFSKKTDILVIESIFVRKSFQIPVDYLYMVRWSIREDYDPEQEQEDMACDWDSPEFIEKL